MTTTMNPTSPATRHQQEEVSRNLQTVSGSRSASAMLTQVAGGIPTTGLVLLLALKSPVFSQRPVLFVGAP